MSDLKLAAIYVETIFANSTTSRLLKDVAQIKGKHLSPAGRVIRDGVRSILAERKAA